MTFEKFFGRALEKFSMSLDGKKFYHTLMFDPKTIQQFEDDGDLDNLVSYCNKYA